MYADEVWALLYDEYLPFRLHSEHQNGKTIETIVAETGMPAHWVRERIAAAEDCVVSGQKLAPPFFDRRVNPARRTSQQPPTKAVA